MNTASPPITLTESAIIRVKILMERADKSVLGLRIGVTNTGCSGHMYQVEYAEEVRPLEEIVEQEGIKIFIDPLAIMFVFGSNLDYVESKLQSGFVFENPNETSRCGCGESFAV